MLGRGQIAIFIIVSILIVAIIVSVNFLQQQRIPLPIECSEETDCELIFSKCNCGAVPINDSEYSKLHKKTILEKDRDCSLNICFTKNVTAICRNNNCVRSDQ
jgi:hypothetical protein